MHRAALDGTGPDERDLHHEVVEILGTQARERGHLGAALYLEHADGVGRGEQRVDVGLLGNGGEIDIHAFVLADEVDGEMQHREHPETEQVELHEAGRRTVVFVPLEHGAILHARPFDRAELDERTVGQHHPAGMDAEMAREVEHLLGEVEREFGDDDAVLGERVEGTAAVPPVLWSRSLGAGIPGPRAFAAPPIDALGEGVGLTG